MTKLLVLALGLWLAGCASTPCLSVKSASVTELRANPYEDLPRAENPYNEAPKAPSCQDLCTQAFTGCVTECKLGGTDEETCMTQCVEEDDCMSKC